MVQRERNVTRREVSRRPPAFFQVNVIADYGGGRAPDHAFNEVAARLRSVLTPEENMRVVIDPHPVSAFATLETGFWIAQIGIENAHPGLIIFSNTAPRGEDITPRNAGVTWHGDEKQPFVYVELDTGVAVFAVHAGYNLSFIKKRARKIVKVDVPNTGTQFRSRDIYAQAVASYIQGNDSILSGEPIDPRTIPDVPEDGVASIDGYGNLKTTIRRSDIKEEVLSSPFVEIQFNGRRHVAVNTLVDGVRGVRGQLCLTVGSSGGNNPYLEVVRLQGRAASDFNVTIVRDDLGPLTIQPIPPVIFSGT